MNDARRLIEGGVYQAIIGEEFEPGTMSRRIWHVGAQRPVERRRPEVGLGSRARRLQSRLMLVE
ncbi:MAG: hypothetical protein U0841_21920 [Chloroflexia bacterium]